MARFRTRSWTIIIWVSIILMIFSSWSVPDESRFKMNLASFLHRPLFIFHSFSQRFKEDALAPRGQFLEENERLRGKLADTSLELKEITSENERLRVLLAFKKKSPYLFIPARVVGRDFSNWSKVILIDKGERDGVRAGQAVVVPEGLIGKVSESGESLSKVTLIMDSNFRISVILQDSRQFAMVEGAHSPGKEIRVKYLERDEALISSGEGVITSGLDSLVPKGILVGRIAEVAEKERGLYLSSALCSSVNFSRLEEVLVVK